MSFFAKIVLVLVMCTCFLQLAAEKKWSWTYTKELLTAEQSGSAVNKKELLIEKKAVSPFTQLIISWNAYRPQHGDFTFWVQGKDARTGVWSSWHKMMSWGAGMQCSYMSNADALAQHHHVRFEACVGKKMSGFRIKITTHNGADLSGLHAVTVAYSDFTQFTPENADKYRDLASVRIKKVPRKSQFTLEHPEKHRLCSPTSCAMLVEYFSHNRCNMHNVAHCMFDKGLDTYGSWPFNMAHAFELCQGSHWWRVVRMNSFLSIYKMLKNECPVAVSVRGYLKGAPKSYDNGHLMVVIGYDAATQRVICHDPACAEDRKSVRKYKLSDFLAAWEKSHRLTYCASKRSR